jgi:hypothetical protein
MANEFKNKYDWHQSKILIDIYPNNEFDEYFGIWPE